MLNRMFGSNGFEPEEEYRDVRITVQPGDYVAMVTLEMPLDDQEELYHMQFMVAGDDLGTFTKVLAQNKISYSVDPVNTGE